MSTSLSVTSFVLNPFSIRASRGTVDHTEEGFLERRQPDQSRSAEGAACSLCQEGCIETDQYRIAFGTDWAGGLLESIMTDRLGRGKGGEGAGADESEVGARSGS